MPSDDNSDAWVPNGKSFPFLNAEGLSLQDVQRAFEGLARDWLPLKVGKRYADVVVKCLTGLEEDSQDLTERKINEDVQVGFDYIDQVLRQLQEIAV